MLLGTENSSLEPSNISKGGLMKKQFVDYDARRRELNERSKRVSAIVNRAAAGGFERGWKAAFDTMKKALDAQGEWLPPEGG
jgi:hypothetical protein